MCACVRDEQNYTGSELDSGWEICLPETMTAKTDAAAMLANRTVGLGFMVTPCHLHRLRSNG